MPRFLLTNDDGISAEGIQTLERAASRFGEIVVVAPDQQHSGCSHQITDKRPIRVTTHGQGRYSLDAYPADCVRLAHLSLAPDCDWVLSGVNHGGNLGVDLFLSGTVAAVREAVILGRKAIAFSQYRRSRKIDNDWNWTARQLERVLPALLAEELEPGQFWNVNFPHPESAHDPEWVFCPPERQPLQLKYQLTEEMHHYDGSYQERPRTAGTDVDVCFGGRIAISRVRVFG